MRLRETEKSRNEKKDSSSNLCNSASPFLLSSLSTVRSLSLSLISPSSPYLPLSPPFLHHTHTHTMQCGCRLRKKRGTKPRISPVAFCQQRLCSFRLATPHSVQSRAGQAYPSLACGEERKKEKGEQRRNCFERKWRRVISSFSLLCATHCGASLQRSLRRAAHHTPPPHSPRWAKFWHDPPLPLAWPPFFPSSFTAAPSPAYATP